MKILIKLLCRIKGVSPLKAVFELPTWFSGNITLQSAYTPQVMQAKYEAAFRVQKNSSFYLKSTSFFEIPDFIN